jgi:4-amino-4-deoxy-L-arabinose transferase-like glycosyltransferase
MSSLKFWRTLLFILLGAMIVYLVGNQSVGLWDRDEPRYAECSREMIQSGDWVVPMFLGQWRLEKPPLIYWCQALAMEVMGATPAAARFPSAVAPLVTGLVIALVVRRYAGPRRALWATLIYCGSGLTIGAAKFCNTDSVLTAFVIGGQACLAVMYATQRMNRKPPIWAAVVFWGLCGLAGLTKGPHVLGMHAITLAILLLLDVSPNFRSAAAWRRSILWWRGLRPLIGIPVMVAVVSPWLILVHERAPGFVMGLFKMAGNHVMTSMDGHGEPPGYHLLLIFGTFFPWSLLLPATIAIAWRNRRLAQVRFAMAAVAGPWLLMEFVRTKLPFYVLPAFGGLSFLAADALIRCARGQYNDLKQKAFFATIVAWCIAGLGLGAGPWFAMLASRDLPWTAMVGFSIAAVLYVAIAVVRLIQGRLYRAAIVMGVGSSFLIVLLYSTILPNFDFLRLSERLATHLPHGPEVRVAMCGYTEPSLAFYQGGGAREKFENYLMKNPPESWFDWIVIDDTDWRAVTPKRKALLEVVGSEQGVAYAATGKAVTVVVLHKLPILSNDLHVTGIIGSEPKGANSPDYP